MIVPHGGTVLETDDLVTVVGSNEAYPAIVAAFTSGIARFPTDFGSSVGVALSDETDLAGPVAEARGLASTSAAESVTLIHQAAQDDMQRARVEGSDRGGGRQGSRPPRPDQGDLGRPRSGGARVAARRSGRTGGGPDQVEAGPDRPPQGRRGVPGQSSGGAAPSCSPAEPPATGASWCRPGTPPRVGPRPRAAIDLGAHTGLAAHRSGRGSAVVHRR